MPALIAAAKATIEQISAGEYHQAALEIEIATLDKRLRPFVFIRNGFVIIVHTVRETPYFLLPRGSENRLFPRAATRSRPQNH